MKLRVEVDGEKYLLDIHLNSATAEYVLRGATIVSGSASVQEVMPGVFSVLMGSKSRTINISAKGDQLEVWAGAQRHTVSVTDTRDRAANAKKVAARGPMEVCSQMPGKVIKLLVQKGEPVKSGQGVIVVEAMKMQNEMKSPKDGIVSKILVTEGATVGPGETLILVE